MADSNSAQEIIRSALVLCGAISQDEQPSASEAQDALNRLNDMLDSWSIDRLTVYALQRLVFPFTGAPVYTLGVGGDFNTVTPIMKIEEAYVQITTTNPVAEVPMKVVEEQEWAQITVKNTTSEIPRQVWWQKTYPLANLTFFPLDTGVNKVVLYCWQGLGSVASLATTLVLPPGYRLAIIYNLAIVLAPFYGKALSNDVINGAIRYKYVVERRNLPEDQMLSCDLGTLSPDTTFNWLTGEAR